MIYLRMFFSIFYSSDIRKHNIYYSFVNHWLGSTGVSCLINVGNLQIAVQEHYSQLRIGEALKVSSKISASTVTSNYTGSPPRQTPPYPIQPRRNFKPIPKKNPRNTNPPYFDRDCAAICSTPR